MTDKVFGVITLVLAMLFVLVFATNDEGFALFLLEVGFIVMIGLFYAGLVLIVMNLVWCLEQLINKLAERMNKKDE